MIRLADFRDLLDRALALLGDGTGQVEVADGDRRVCIGRPAKRMVSDGPVASAVGVLAGETIRVVPVEETMTVRSPAVGVVNFIDNRTGRALVSVGQKVVQGQTLAFITALDITTKVISPVEGVVEEVIVEDGDGVEYHAPLLKVLPVA